MTSGDDQKSLQDLVKENNEILKQIRGGQRRNRIFTVLYWLVIIGVSLGFFYYLQPIFTKLKELLTGLAGNVANGAGNVADINLLQSLLEQLGGK